MLKFALIFLSTAVSLAFAELILRIWFSAHLNYDIEMWRYSRLLKMPTHDARLHVHVPNASATIMGRMVKTNSLGLRDKEYPVSNPNAYRILCVGDSFTFGFGVEQDKTFCKIIEKNLHPHALGQPLETINLGIGNYNTAQELALLKSLAGRIKAQHILLAFYLNDAEDAQHARDDRIANNFYSTVFIKSIIYKVKALIIPREQYREYYNRLYRKEGWENYQKTLDAFVGYCHENGLRLTVVILPDLIDLQAYPFSEIHQKITTYFTNHSVPVIDAIKYFDHAPSQQYWVAPDDPHPNQMAHEIIADAIVKELQI